MRVILGCALAGMMLGVVGSLPMFSLEDSLSYSSVFGLIGGLSGATIKLVGYCLRTSNLLLVIGLGGGFGFFLGFLAGLGSASSAQLGILYGLLGAAIAAGVRQISFKLQSNRSS